MKKYLTKSRILALVLVLTLICGTAVTATGAKRVKSKSVALDVTSVTLGIGDVATLDATMKPINTTDSLKWSSSNKKVAIVNKYGTITAKGEGSATITVKTTSKKTAKCKVTVKKYLTKAEAQALISSNVLPEESIVDLIKKNGLSEEDVITLIQQKSLSTEAVTTLINSKVISENKVIELIKGNSLSEGEVLTLIKNSTLSEEAIVKLIMENTLTEDDVKKLIAQNSGGPASDDWEDGTTIKLYERQSLPYQCTVGDAVITIKSAEAKKYHYDAEYEGYFEKYKFVYSFTGKIENYNVNRDYCIWCTPVGQGYSKLVPLSINDDGTFNATNTDFSNIDCNEILIVTAEIYDM